ncbi:hypothetical protein B5S32_g1864 [[Candida] boidinii]|nr:hypothetical protein B5S32_g1864 [[Candida] boidinii]
MNKNLYVLGHDANARLLISQLSFAIDKSKTSLALLFNDETTLKDYIIGGSTVSYENRMSKRNSLIKTTNFKASIYPVRNKFQNNIGSVSNSNPHIDNLIITNRSCQNSNILNIYKRNISENTNILFVNPGLGVIDTVLKESWGSNSSLYPNVFQGVSNHIIESGKNFKVRHYKAGNIKISAYPSGSESYLQFMKLQESYFPNDTDVPEMVSDLIDSPMLNALYTPFKDVLGAQIEKLIIDACIIPLVILLNCGYKDISISFHAGNTISRVLDECIYVLSSVPYVKQLRQVDPSTNLIFDKQRLFDMVLQTARQYDRCTSSIVDTNSDKSIEGSSVGNVSDILYVNGYISALAQRINFNASANNTLLEMVQAKRNLKLKYDSDMTIIA